MGMEGLRGKATLSWQAELGLEGKEEREQRHRVGTQ